MSGRKTTVNSARNTQVGKKDIVEHDERMVPEFHKGNEIYGEHLARYEVGREYVTGKIVLDVASGSGYGTKILSHDAKKVYGVDISSSAINYAKKYYANNNLEYRVGEGSQLPVEDNSIEVVTSFETIEHIADYKKFLKEVKRVLTNDGQFIVSTPNDLEFTQGNHFHLHQFNEEELIGLLKEQYKYVDAYYQTTWLFNIVGPSQHFTDEWVESVRVMQTTKLPKEKVLYFYFVCSDEPITQKMKPLGAIGEHWSERAVREKDNLTAAHIDNLENINRGNVEYIKKLEGDLYKLMKELEWEKRSVTKKLVHKMNRIKKA
jgi:ubiquinone/menaquinone biosynthesis C-methylase UbiE